MSEPSSHETAVKRLRWLLLLPPCLPGALMLLTGFFLDPLRPAQDATRACDASRRQQANVLYTAGEVALLGGALMAALTAWKILRPPPPDEEEDEPAP